MIYYDIEADWHRYTLDITPEEYPSAEWNRNHEDTWCKGEEVARMRRRLLVKLLRERGHYRAQEARAALSHGEAMKCRRTEYWCFKIASRIEVMG
jgi:hypothetical protein